MKPIGSQIRLQPWLQTAATSQVRGIGVKYPDIMNIRQSLRKAKTHGEQNAASRKPVSPDRLPETVRKTPGNGRHWEPDGPRRC